MKIHIMGRHAHRTPFAYAPYRTLFKQKFDYVDDPKTADVIVFGYVLNIDENADEIARLRKANPDLRLVVVSEEPLWDTTNSGDFRKRHNTRELKDHSFRYSVINHHTSDVYAFEKIPYFLTTDNEFFLRYAFEFSQNTKLTTDEIKQTWAKAQIRYAFFAENRDLVKKYSVKHPDIETYGLSVYRTDVAKAMPDRGTLRVGQGWGAKLTRQKLPDWHLEKLVTLQGEAFIISAVENTCQRNYISEKIFDALACRGLPLIWAPAFNRVHEFVEPYASLNLYDLSPEQAAKTVQEFTPRRETFEAYAATQAKMQKCFHRFDDFISERLGFYDRISTELEAVLSEREGALH